VVDYDEYWKGVHDKQINKRTRMALHRSRKLRIKKYGSKKLSKKEKLKNRLNKKRASLEYSSLRKSVILKANGQCSLCCVPTDTLIMHHIEMVKDSPKRILDEKNIIAICRTCHKEIHPWLR
jgi:5-methylcytosine-specific restriction endonuclease McrA